MTRVLTTLLITLVFITHTNADSFEPFYAQREPSATLLTFASISPNDKAPGCTVIVDTRIAAGRNLGARPVREEAHAAFIGGPVRTLKTMDLDYKPNLIRVSDRHLALIGYYGDNRDWLEKNSAVRLISLATDKNTSVEISLDDFIPSADHAVYESPSQIAWLRDAWFSNDDRRLVICLWLNLEKARDTPHILSIDVDSGKVASADQTLAALIDETDQRFHPAVYDVAAISENVSLRERALSTLSDQNATIAVRVHAAAYLVKTTDSQEAKNYLASIAALNAEESLEHELVLISSTIDDPIGFAARCVRESNLGIHKK